MGGHLGRVMIKDFLHDMLWDVPVYQDRPQRVTPLVGGEMDRCPVLVADVAVRQPAVEGSPVGGAADRPGSGQVRLRPGEQHWGAVRPPEADAVVLGADHGQELVIDGHECLAFHFRVVVAQVGAPSASVTVQSQGRLTALEIRSPQRIRITVSSR